MLTACMCHVNHMYYVNACMNPAVWYELRIAFVVRMITIHLLIFSLSPKFACPCRPETWREICPSEAEEDRQETMDQLSSYLVCLYELCTLLEVTTKHMCIPPYQAYHTLHILSHSAHFNPLCTEPVNGQIVHKTGCLYCYSCHASICLHCRTS